MLDERSDGYITYCALAKLNATEKCTYTAHLGLAITYIMRLHGECCFLIDWCVVCRQRGGGAGHAAVGLPLPDQGELPA